ncbi:C-type lectin domain family 17 member A-like 3, partial [Homarus americanus]
MINFTLTVLLLSCVVVNSYAECQDPFIQIGESCYYFSDLLLSYQEARKYCRSLSANHRADLAVFDQIDCDYHHVFSHMHQYDQEVDGFWIWVDGRPIDLKASYWSKDEPAVSDTNNCLVMFS